MEISLYGHLSSVEGSEVRAALPNFSAESVALLKR